MSEQASQDLAKGTITTLEEALQDNEKRKAIDELLERFSKVKREEFITRYATFARYIDELCGKDTSNILFMILSKPLPEVENVLKQIVSNDVRKWLRQLNSKYVSVYEGVFPPIPHDWYRVFWSTKIDFTHGNIPLIEATILKRNGESLFLEMPFTSMVTLINHLLGQICETKEVRVLEIPRMQQKLKQTKSILESVLGS